jgi:hypothetical protein
LSSIENIRESSVFFSHFIVLQGISCHSFPGNTLSFLESQEEEIHLFLPRQEANVAECDAQLSSPLLEDERCSQQKIYETLKDERQETQKGKNLLLEYINYFQSWNLVCDERERESYLLKMCVSVSEKIRGILSCLHRSLVVRLSWKSMSMTMIPSLVQDRFSSL